MNWTNRTILLGDNLHGLISIEDNSVDLVYADPPFFSGRTYQGVKGSPAERASFRDVWNVPSQAEEDRLWYASVLAWDLIKRLPNISKPFQTYLTFMALRLRECQRILKPTGALYLHCDVSAVAHLRLFCDVLFGPQNFRNMLVWKYDTFHASTRAFTKNYDTILVYAKDERQCFFDWKQAARPYNKATLARFDKEDDKGKYKMVKGRKIRPGIGVPPGACFAFPQVALNQDEYVGWPTQKPLSLMRLLVALSVPKGGMVCDPFLGSGTMAMAAEAADCAWIGMERDGEIRNVLPQRMEWLLGIFAPDIIFTETVPRRPFPK